LKVKTLNYHANSVQHKQDIVCDNLEVMKHVIGHTGINSWVETVRDKLC